MEKFWQSFRHQSSLEHCVKFPQVTKFNIHPEKLASRKENSLTTIIFQRRTASFHGCTGWLSNQQFQAELGYQGASNTYANMNIPYTPLKKNMAWPVVHGEAFPSINVSYSTPRCEVLNCSVTTLTSAKRVDLFDNILFFYRHMFGIAFYTKRSFLISDSLESKPLRLIIIWPWACALTCLLGT